MNKFILIIILGLIFLTIGLSGCFDFFTTSDIEGVWYEGDYAEWNFHKNGNLSIKYYSGETNQYTWDMDSRYVYVIDNDYTIKYRYTALNDDNTLLLESFQESITLNRG